MFNVLLQVLDDGRLTDGKGRTVNFSNTVIIMTSNVGSSDLQTAKIGFSLTHDGRNQNQAIRTRLMAELSRTFRPEFLNRIDDIIVFNSLAREHLGKIVELQLRISAEASRRKKDPHRGHRIRQGSAAHRRL